MNEPRRLVEESDSPLERALLSAGASYRVSPETRAKTLAALGLASAAALSASIAAPAVVPAAKTLGASSLAAKFGWGKIVVALSTVGALAGIPAGYLAWRAQHVPSPAAVARFGGSLAGPIARAMPPAAPAEPAVPRVADAPAPADVDSDRSTVSRPGARPSGASVALQEELKTLDGARAALASGNAQRALSLLDDHARAYPRGRLRLEAEVLRIDALAKSGQLNAARQRATTFLRRHPNSVLASRVRRYVND